MAVISRRYLTMSKRQITTREKNQTGMLYSGQNKRLDYVKSTVKYGYYEPFPCVIPPSAANKCSLKVAQYAAQLERYDKAIRIYEQVQGFV